MPVEAGFDCRPERWPDRIEMESGYLVGLMEQAVREGVFPGAVLCIQHRNDGFYSTCCGRLSVHRPTACVTMRTVYDLASLTKVLAMTSVVLDCIRRREFDLETPVAEAIPDFAYGRVLVGHLLQHTSGLATWRPYFEEVAAAAGGGWIATERGKAALRSMLLAEPLQSKPGVRVEYSDLGFILLDWFVERRTGAPLDRLFDRRIARRLGLRQLFFVDLKRPRQARRLRQGRSFADTERCAWRLRTLCAEVHDENCYVMGGVSGHAGLFGTAGDTVRLAAAWLDAARGRKSVFDGGLVRRFWSRSSGLGSSRALGFDTPSTSDSQAGGRMGPATVGHLGFTGTSVWIDPDRELIIALLTNRINPSRENQAIRGFRPVLHDAVVSEFEAGTLRRSLRS
ncbi:MAG: beta-lactamase family protein [Deltaproteobacteria bacterium]|nr:beta-lactamase family protein [Deltaproteobacteria bacterium]